jgi:hypothetical protein
MNKSKANIYNYKNQSIKSEKCCKQQQQIDLDESQIDTYEFKNEFNFIN